MNRRKQTSRGSTSDLELPSLPFLSIMLGLMSVMAIITMGIAVEKRQETKQSHAVKLVGIPEEFIPCYVRCTRDEILWMEDNGRWQSTPLGGDGPEGIKSYSGLIRFIDFMREKGNENLALSYARKQNTVILWVEPEGVRNAIQVRALLEATQIPLRTGMLPVLEGEEIRGYVQ